MTTRQPRPSKAGASASAKAASPMSRILVGVSAETTWDVLESQLRSMGFDRVQKPTPELPDVGAVLVAPGKVDKALAQLGRTDGVAFAEVERMRFSQ